MLSKISDSHLQKKACIYIRQSTMMQVRHHRESTERQYGLKHKAQELGWPAKRIELFDGDLGRSGAQASGREAFKTLVAEVSMGQVGAVFALEASRLARSNTDWHRLIELCSFTRTLIIDEDGCYNPAEFNDGLLLGLKATMSQAELHFIRARLQGGKLNKAKKGELRRPLPAGYCYDDEDRIVVDPDEQVREAVRKLFSLFRETGSACATVRRFYELGLEFPTRVRGGAWNGKLSWGRLAYCRALAVLKNPIYAGVYVYGRYQQSKELNEEGELRTRIKLLPQSSWPITLHQHHEGYIRWEDYLHNQKVLENNRTKWESTVLKGPAREGLALLQGLLLCGTCGRRLTTRYRGNGGIYAQYLCLWKRQEGVSRQRCMSVRCDLLDATVAERVIEMLQPAQLEIAVQAVQELERRDKGISSQWRMRLERVEYEAALAQRRYEEVDPANRLVASTLERRWNDALLKLEETRHQFEQFEQRHRRLLTDEQKSRVLALAEDFPRLWNAPTTKSKERKRMLRLLIKDITVEKSDDGRTALLHLRWQGGACEDLYVELPPKVHEQVRYPDSVVKRVGELAQSFNDKQIVDLLNGERRLSAKGKPFTVPMIQWIRRRSGVPQGPARRANELTIAEVADKFETTRNVARRWIQQGLVDARKGGQGMFWITIHDSQQPDLLARAKLSRRHPSFRKTLHEKGAV